MGEDDIAGMFGGTYSISDRAAWKQFLDQMISSGQGLGLYDDGIVNDVRSLLPEEQDGLPKGYTTFCNDDGTAGIKFDPEVLEETVDKATDSEDDTCAPDLEDLSIKIPDGYEIVQIGGKVTFRKILVPDDGEFITIRRGSKTVVIVYMSEGSHYPSSMRSYISISLDKDDRAVHCCLKGPEVYVSDRNSVSIEKSTEKERELLEYYARVRYGVTFDHETKQIIDLRWFPKQGDIFWFVKHDGNEPFLGQYVVDSISFVSGSGESFLENGNYKYYIMSGNYFRYKGEAERVANILNSSLLEVKSRMRTIASEPDIPKKMMLSIDSEVDVTKDKEFDDRTSEKATKVQRPCLR